MGETQLSIFDESTADEKMSIYDVAVSFSVVPRTIQRYVEKYFPLSVKNGVRTMLNEQQVTFIKLKLQEAKNLDSVVELPKTDLEKELLIQQAMSFQAEKIANMQKQLEEAQPKIEFHDQVGDSTGKHNMAETAKLLNLGFGRNTLMKTLREIKILMKNNMPYQMYIDLGYFEVKENVIGGDQKFVKAQTYVTPNGLIWLQKRFK